MKHEVAGDPITGLKWSRKTPKKIAGELAKVHIHVSATTVRRLMKTMKFSLRVNHQKLGAAREDRGARQARDWQFQYISQMRDDFAAQGLPIISVDTKKKELVGNFKNGGQSWEEEPTWVRDHTFASDAIGKAAPHGIYDTQANTGFVSVGMSADTPAFAVDNLERWWRLEGQARYPRSSHLLILADSGGSNAARSRVWKCGIQKQLCDSYGLTVTVCHYPPGASKWNPIEHRLFSEITKNWAGRPLRTFQAVLNYIRTTKTTMGLRVKAHLVRRKYATGQTASDEDMQDLALTQHQECPAWNYTIEPRKM